MVKLAPLFAKTCITLSESKMSIPKRELLVAHLGARFTKFVRNALTPMFDIKNSCMWSDSKSTIARIKTSIVLPNFVEN